MRKVKTTSRERIEHPSVPKQPVTWTEEDVRRLLALDVRVCQWVKPAETAKLYGITQRLSAMRMRKDGSVNGHQLQEQIERMPDLSAEQCAFLYDVIKRILDGERDAFKALGLSLPDRNPGNPRTPFMAAEYELMRRFLPKALHKRIRHEVADRYGVTVSRVSQAHSRHRPEIEAWIVQALHLADVEHIPHELMLRHLAARVRDQADWFVDTQKGSTLNDTPAENLFNISFPLLLVNRAPSP